MSDNDSSEKLIVELLMSISNELKERNEIARRKLQLDAVYLLPVEEIEESLTYVRKLAGQERDSDHQCRRCGRAASHNRPICEACDELIRWELNEEGENR